MASFELPDYAELQAISHFTFLRGASSPEQLIERSAKLGYKAIAIADECSMAGIVKAHLAAKAVGIKLLIGTQLTVTPDDGTAPFKLLLLAQTRRGYGDLCELITAARMRSKKGEYLVRPEDISSPSPHLGHIRGLPECQIILTPEYGAEAEAIATPARWLASFARERTSIAITLHYRSNDDAHKATVGAVAGQLRLPVVATGDVCMHLRSYKPVQDTMTAIRNHLPVAKCGFLLASNAEGHLRSRVRLGNLYTREQIKETIRIADRCTFTLDELRYEYPLEIVPGGHTPATYLRQEAYLGAHWRYPKGIPDNVQMLIERELAIIAQLQYEPYFLTVYDIVRFARANKILCQGRGSAANSAVCYCLGITEVDPARGTLLFERFISVERDEPPDIDLDTEHQRREEIFQYIYAKYGRERAGLTAVVRSYRSRSVLRDVGVALGISEEVALKVARAGHTIGATADLFERISACGLDPENHLVQKWVMLSEHMMNFPKYLSQHPGGFVLAKDRLSRLVPIENARMANRSVIQWDKDDIDAVGLLKVDVLALGMLSCIRRALALVSEVRGETFELHDIPAEDAATYDMISNADTCGTFQLESRAQMATLPRMRPRCFYDLVIEVALIRPGPLQGDMVHPYLRRRDGVDPVTYPHALEPVLARTLGIPIFQEQVMQIAMVAAGFTAGEADRLRRAMAAWKRKGGLEEFDEKIRAGMGERGYDTQFTEAILKQIRGFSEYGFPESHAASFALIAYASCWLKCHEPEAFLTALLNSQPMGFYTPSQLIQDAERHGVKILPIRVNESAWESSLEFTRGGSRPAVRLGLNLIRGLAQEAGWRIEEARAVREFSSIHDMALRANLAKPDLELLASASALAGLSGNRREAMWAATGSAPGKGLLRTASIEEAQLILPAPSEGGKRKTSTVWTE